MDFREGLARFLEGVLLPTLPPYRSDTSINFFLGDKERLISPLWGGGVEES